MNPNPNFNGNDRVSIWAENSIQLSFLNWYILVYVTASYPVLKVIHVQIPGIVQLTNSNGSCMHSKYNYKCSTVHNSTVTLNRGDDT